MKLVSIVVSILFSAILTFSFVNCGSSSSSSGGGGGGSNALTSDQATAVTSTFTAAAQSASGSANQTPAASLTSPMLVAGDVMPQGLSVNTATIEYRTDPTATGYTSQELITLVASGGAPDIKAMYYSGTCDTSGTFTALIENGDGDNLFSFASNTISAVDMDPFKMTYTFTDCVEVCECGANTYSYEFDGQLITTMTGIDTDPCTAQLVFATSNFQLDNVDAALSLTYDLTSSTDTCDDVTVTCDDNLTSDSYVTTSEGTMTKSDICSSSC